MKVTYPTLTFGPAGTGCLESTGPVLNTGYPYVVDNDKSSSSVYTARRYVLAVYLGIHHDALPSGPVRNTCGNKLCVTLGHMKHSSLEGRDLA